MSATANRPRHIYELDYLRVLAMLAVVIMHVTSLFRLNTTLNPLVLGLAFADELERGFETPLFVLISGAVLAQNWHGQFSASQFYWARLERIIGPYLFFGSLYLLPDIVAGRMGLGRVLFELAFAGGAGHLWFIALIVQLYLLYPLLVRWEARQSLRSKLVFLALSAILQVAWGGLDRYLWLNPRYISVAGVELGVYSLVHRVFLSRYFYFVLGIMIGRHWQAVTDYWRQHLARFGTLLVLATLLMAAGLTLIRLRELGFVAGSGGAYALQPVLRLLEHLFGLGLLYEVARRIPAKSLWAHIVQPLNQLSYSIYLAHYGVLQGVVFMLARVGLAPTTLLFYPVALAITLGLTVALVSALGSLPYSHLYIGVHASFRKRGAPSLARESTGET